VFPAHSGLARRAEITHDDIELLFRTTRLAAEASRLEQKGSILQNSISAGNFLAKF
jgi:hypothetical protein